MAHADHIQHSVSDSPGTVLESFDSWAELLRRRPPSLTPSTPAMAPEALPYRPTRRRPLALLHVIDDGCEGGETVRLRGERLVIGRTEGDVKIAHDVSMSPRHAVLECLAGGPWRLVDAGSVDGTFVRAVGARLHHGSCVQLGASRLRFESLDGGKACLVEITPHGDGTRHSVEGETVTIGRVDTGCQVGLADRFMSPVHAELRYVTGGWRIENRGLNGLWVRIDGPVRLAVPSQFQCGEQRFVFVPDAGQPHA